MKIAPDSRGIVRMFSNALNGFLISRIGLLVFTLQLEIVPLLYINSGIVRNPFDEIGDILSGFFIFFLFLKCRNQSLEIGYTVVSVLKEFLVYRFSFGIFALIGII